jgi:hypothetical protein
MNNKKKKKRKEVWPGAKAQVCNPSYFRGGDYSRPVWTESSRDRISINGLAW